MCSSDLRHETEDIDEDGEDFGNVHTLRSNFSIQTAVSRRNLLGAINSYDYSGIRFLFLSSCNVVFLIFPFYTTFQSVIIKNQEENKKDRRMK